MYKRKALVGLIVILLVIPIFANSSSVTRGLGSGFREDSRTVEPSTANTLNSSTDWDLYDFTRGRKSASTFNQLSSTSLTITSIGWTSKASLPQPRIAAAGAELNGKIYAIGGYQIPPANFTEIDTNTNFVYDSVSDSWTTGSPVPTKRSFAQAAVVLGKIYVMGGLNQQLGNALNLVEVYDPALDSWTSASPMPTARGAVGLAVVDDIIYAIGGISGFPGTSVNVVEAYNPATDSWSAKSSMPTGRGAPAASVMGGKIYVIGGEVFPSGDSLNVVESYDPTADSWLTGLSPMPTPRGFLSAVSIPLKNRIIAVGGFNPSPNATSSFLDENEAYDVASDSWGILPPMPTGRAAMVAAEIGGFLYTIGGINNLEQSVAVNEVFDTSIEPSPIFRDLAILAVSPSSMTVEKGNPVNVMVVVENQGNIDELAVVNVLVNGTIASSVSVALGSGGVANVSVVWSTLSFAVGNYIIAAEVPLSGDSDPGDNFLQDGIVTLVPPVTVGFPFFDDAESGPDGWTALITSGTTRWHLVTGAENVTVLSPDINPNLVTLPEGVPAVLPQANSGQTAWWFGHESTGTFIGQDWQSVTQSPKNGGQSLVPQSGDLTSPLIDLTGVGTAVLDFWSWWEIESASPSNFDRMEVYVTVDGGVNWIFLGGLNPPGPGGSGDVPFSSGGFNQLGIWVENSFDLGPYAGNLVKVRFRFNSGDTLYNGFRGWFIDDISVTAGPARLEIWSDVYQSNMIVDSSLGPGSQLVLKANLSGAGMTNGYDMTIQYNTAVLDATNVTLAGTLFDAATLPPDCTLFILIFDVDSPPGTIHVALSTSCLLDVDNAIPILVMNFLVTSEGQSAVDIVEGLTTIVRIGEVVPYLSKDGLVNTVGVLVNHDVAVVNVVPSPTSTPVGQPVSIQVMVQNQGTEFEFVTVAALANGIVVANTTFGIGPGFTSAVTMTWNTNGFNAGSYLIVGQVLPVPGETDTGDNTFIDGTVFLQSIQPLHDVGLLFVDVNPKQIVSGQLVQVIVGIENKGQTSETVSIIVKFDSIVATVQNNVFIPPGPSTIFLSLPPWDTSGVPPGTYVISATVTLVGATDENPANNMLNDGTVTILPPPEVTLTPSSGVLGTKVVVHGTGFPSSPFGPGVVLVSFDDMFLGFTLPVNGTFDFTFNVPHAQPGLHDVKVFDPVSGLEAATAFTVLPEVAIITGDLVVTVDVGAVYFPGDTADIYVLVTLNGNPAAPEHVQLVLVLVKPDGSNTTLNTALVAQGLYKASFAVPKSGATGTYALVATAEPLVLLVGHGFALRVFEVKASWVAVQGPRVASATAIVGIAAVVAVAWRKGYLKRRDNDTLSPS